MRNAFLIFVIFCSNFLYSQGSFPPNASTTGTSAIHKDSSIFINWATGCSVNRGWQNILDTNLGKVSAGNEMNATGKSGLNGTVSLGDNGSAILTFQHPIFNGLGPDFAVFENSFNDSFLELAFVEVSSNGIDFVRFPSYSETQDTVQVDGFGELDATNIHNLAGKYRSGYGTPFDLEDLSDSTAIDINHISHIKIIDVVGIINNANTNYDANLNQINDPFPTPYSTSGFDLDAVGIIHQFVSVNENKELSQKLYPNPSNGILNLQFDNLGEKTIKIIEDSGKVVETIITNHKLYQYHKRLKKGVYIIVTKTKRETSTSKLIIY